mmetsp:Transcript_8530/g.26650  ORF Transcript_8530/g.26650 Transcript_8530/m.26650 type:complete len:94 (+) Transcript_8530:889-1170(+)
MVSAKLDVPVKRTIRARSLRRSLSALSLLQYRRNQCARSEAASSFDAIKPGVQQLSVRQIDAIGTFFKLLQRNRKIVAFLMLTVTSIILAYYH